MLFTIVFKQVICNRNRIHLKSNPPKTGITELAFLEFSHCMNFYHPIHKNTLEVHDVGREGLAHRGIHLPPPNDFFGTLQSGWLYVFLFRILASQSELSIRLPDGKLISKFCGRVLTPATPLSGPCTQNTHFVTF